MRMSNETESIADHLFLAPDVTVASLRSALLRHTAETAEVDEGMSTF